jgi:predicted metal-dependent phosphoesterase TrpH
MRIDFHVHTNHSPDSVIKPKDLAKKSLALGLIPAVADHNSISSHKEMRQYAARFIPAEEISTDRGDLIFLFANELVKRRTPFTEALDIIHECGGLAYLPHMYDKTRHGAVPAKDEIRKIDIVEVFNPRCLDPVYNSRAKVFAQKNGIPQAAGSDSHFLFEFGKTYTEMPEFDIEDPKALMRSLKGAKLVTSPAPFYVRGTTSLVKLWKGLRRKA